MVGTSLAPIDIKLEGIAHVLRDRRLSVPPYQRGYSWETEEVSDFWWDLRAAFGSSESQYFLGTIVLTADGKGRTTIIDGQQRLATTSLLFTAIRNEFLRRGDDARAQVVERDYVTTSDLRSAEPVPRLALNPEDRQAFAAAVSHPSASEVPAEHAEHRLVNALRFFQQRVRQEAKNAGGHWADALFEWVDFLEHRARVIAVEVSDEADAFLIFETLNARGRELTVADLLKNYLFGLARDRIETLQDQWVSALTSLEASADEELFSTFIRHLWGSMNGATRERELYSRIKAGITSVGAATAFGSELEAAAPFYAALLSPEDPYWEDFEELIPAMESLLRLGLEQNRPLLLAAIRRFDGDEFGRLVRAVIAWSVRGLVVGGIGGGTTERAFGDAAVAVSERTARSTDDVFQLLQPVIAPDTTFRTAFSIRRINRTRIAKYMLVALAQYELGADDPSVVSESYDGDFSLRFVLPRNASSQTWPAFPEDEISQWALRLGNQFVEAPDGTLWPAARPDTVTAWSPSAIAARQEELAEAAVALWPRSPAP